MKKITFLIFLIGTFFGVNAQVLNQNAGWPNTTWTVTGSYNTSSLAFEADPTTTANFAFDDDDAGNGNEDNIAAESPVIDLSPAFTAGETWLSVTVQYGYRYLANDRLRFEYWNAATSSWVAWGASNILGNDTNVLDNFCTITKTAYTTSILNIVGFSTAQLSGFKYRISYDDDPAGNDWNWGFCFDSPTIVSSTPPSCPDPSVLAAVPSVTSATLSWTENGSATLYNIEYGPNGFTQGTGNLISGISNSYELSPLTPGTAYSYYVQAACGGSAGNSAWVGPFDLTTLFTPPANDECAVAIALTPGGIFADNPVTGTTLGATTSTVTLPACPTIVPTGNGDVWYSVVVPASGNLTIETQVTPATSLIDTVVVAYSGVCGSLVEVGCDDDGGPTGANGLMSLLPLTAQTPGSTVYIGVWKYGTTAPSVTENGFRISAYDASLGNNSFDNTNFSYYPNPVKNTLNLSYNQEISNVEVFNLLGQKVSSNVINANAAQIDMSNLSKGAYIVKVTSNNQLKTIKVIKE